MKIGVDIREFERGKMTGIARYLMNFLAYATVARPEWTFFLYGNQHTHLHFWACNMTWRVVPEYLTVWWDQVTLWRQLRRDHIHVFLSPYVKGPICSPCPFVVTIHDLMFLVYPEYATWRAIPKHWLFKRMASTVGNRAKWIITDSHYSQGDIQRILNLSEEKIVVLPVGVTDAYRPIRNPSTMAKTKRKYGIKAPYVLYVGNFKPHKNVGTLLEGFSRLPLSLQARYGLVLAGGGGRAQMDLARFAERLGIADQVVFTGHVAEEDLPALYAGAAVFVFPSLYEGFGLPVLEAMACGAPVIASNRTSIPEVVGDAGILFDPEDTNQLRKELEGILRDRDRGRALAQRGFERAQRFRANDLCERHLELLEKAAGE